jgi:hypothetical protein
MKTSTAAAALGACLIAALPIAGLPVAAQETAPAATAAAVAERPELRIHRATSEIRVDGHLDEPAWADAARIELAYELVPGDSTPAPVRTEVLVTHDRESFYFAVRAFDPDPASVRARLTDRDHFARDDYVGIVLDTFRDQRRAFEFEVNPLGVQTDYLRSEVTGGFAFEDPTWDALWDSAGRLTEEGYVVEAAIPFHSLRFPRTEGEQVWGFSAYRIHPRSVLRVLSVVPLDRNDPCLLCQVGTIRGMDGITPGKNLELAPAVTAARVDRRPELAAGSLEEGDLESELGLSARWGITPNLSLNGAINPDFSQVEADAAQLEVNTRFALFYPEKRPFFLEGADAFDTPLDAVYTRRIADPRWGIKLSGKEGKNLVGVYAVEDEETSLLFPANQGSDLAVLSLDTRAAVVRYRRDLGKSSTLGALFTGREGGDYSNRVYGLDATFALGPSDTIQVQALESETRYPEPVALDHGQPRDGFNGSGLYARWDHNSQNWGFWGGWSEVEEGFRADLGFIPRVDLATAQAGGKRILRREEGSWFTWLEFGLEASRTTFSRESDVTDQAVAFVGRWEGPLQSLFSWRIARERELFRGVTYDQDVQGFLLATQPTGDLAFTLSGELGDAIDYAGARAADLFRLAPGVNYRFGRHLDVDLQHVLERLDARDGGRVYEANLSQVRLGYQLNVRTFVRAILQYLDLDAPGGGQEDLFSQLLFSYKLNPQTVFFLGYSDNQLGLTGVDLTRTDRAFFAKVGYSWVW